MASHQRLDWLLDSIVTSFLEQKQVVPCFFQTSSGTGRASLLLLSVGEIKSKEQSELRGRGIDFTSLSLEKNAHTGKKGN